MGMKRKEIGDAPMPDPIRLIAFSPDDSRKFRVFPDDQDRIEDAVRWEWDRLHEGANIVEYY